MKTIAILLACIAGLSPRYSPQEVREDLSYLYTTLQGAHYNLYANKSKASYDSAYNRLYSSITDSMTKLEVTRLFQSFIALGEIAHCNIGFPAAAYFDSVVQHTDHMFPLNLSVVKGKVVVLDNFSSDRSIQPGDEISFDQFDETLDMMSGESRAMRGTIVDLYGFPRIYWWRFGSQKSFTVRVNRTRTVKLAGIPAKELEQRMEQVKPIFNTERNFRMIGDIAYLHPGMFLNNNANVNTSAHSTFENNEFIHFIDSAFRKIHEAHARKLLIDLRGNPGGDNSFSDPMIAYFADKPFWFCHDFSVRTSAVTKQFWKDVTDTSLLELKKQIMEHANGDTFSVKFNTYPPRTDSLHFRGMVYALVDKYSYSNTVSVAAIIQDYHLGTVLGVPTADVATTYGAAHEMKLPHTGLDVSYPKALIVRANGDKKLRGVTPDVILEDNPFTPTDDMLDAAIRYITDMRQKSY